PQPALPSLPPLPPASLLLPYTPLFRSRTMISFSDRHLALQDLHVRLLDAPANVIVQSSLIGYRSQRPVASPGELDGSGSAADPRDRKSTRLNSSHVSLSYAVFRLEKKN